MQILDVEQGTDQWLEIRSKHPHTASDASIVMGESKKITRAELIRLMATGTEKEVSDFVRDTVFAEGHRVEAAARPIAEEIIGDDLFPVTAISDDGFFLASYDGLTMDESTGWECKQWNQEKVACIEAGRVPAEDLWQVVQQLAIGVEKILYMVTDGTPENTRHLWVQLEEHQKFALIAGWRQFDADLEEAKKNGVEVIQEKPEGRAPDQLPSLQIQIVGEVKSSNLAAFKANALQVIKSINKELHTDEDFADAEKTVKWCSEVEKKLEQAKKQAIAQTATIEELFIAIDSITAEARQTRLDLEKLVASRKIAVRNEIKFEAQQALKVHIQTINSRIGNGYEIPAVPADFDGAMKNKRNLQSLRDAVDQVLADSKIKASEFGDRMGINIDLYKKEAAGYEFLFSDIKSYLMNDSDSLRNMIKVRIMEHKAAEEKRLAAEAEQKLQEEERLAQQKKTVVEVEAVRETINPDPTQRGEEISRAKVTGFVNESRPSRPTDGDIISVLALHYRVHESTVIRWLLDMDLHEESKKLARSM